MKKDVNMTVAVRISELEDNWFKRLPGVIGPLYSAVKDSGKKKVTYRSDIESRSDYESEASDMSVTQELSEQAAQLQISEKQKRGSKVVVDDNPPMERTPKRTPKRGRQKPVKLTARMTRSKTRRSPGRTTLNLKKTHVRAPTVRSPVKTPLAGRRTPKTSKPRREMAVVPPVCTPGTRGALSKPRKEMAVVPPVCTPVTRRALERLQYHNKVIDEFKTFDAIELQKVCKKEGVPYNRKIKSIFDTTDKRAMLRFGATVSAEAEIISIDKSATPTEGPDRDAPPEVEEA
ncbi:hypothetical protein CBR_g50755 [Chara braunii]|uniref:Uncharacterized protein n=1 Tax=Chara braunii TaxID=69332 RepID=A0A388K5Q5_CHABU|nr:hypothetical protein CBR_g50755 [Chara braunii]|eukprot:GBG65394.1 hypothetical protein CBR_g50755 [Chara braunii]